MNWITHSPRFEQLLVAVEREFGVPREVIHGAGRKQSAIVARHAFWWLLRRHTRHSLPELGEAMDPPRDHTTIMSAVKAFEARRTSPELSAALERIEAEIAASARPVQRVRVAVDEVLVA